MCWILLRARYTLDDFNAHDVVYALVLLDLKLLVLVQHNVQLLDVDCRLDLVKHVLRYHLKRRNIEVPLVESKRHRQQDGVAQPT